MGRDTARKQALNAALAERLERECGLRPEDLVVSLAEVGRDDWSFGNGRAQFVTGELQARPVGRRGPPPCR
ncbi:tautomerase family protein [Nocardioides scoriae]|uniref:tautomerase family protein n=1 Tax=Nocardioides scoriae TaxID=642780 RepID=UPI000B806C97